MKQLPAKNTKFSPQSVFYNPLWWTALSLFILNDHVFKWHSWLPNILTGKLSDVTGLFFSPPLFAALLFVRTKRGVFTAYALTGLLFALLNLVPMFSIWIVEFGEKISWPMTSTMDYSDLLTLPVLFLSWKYFSPQMKNPPQTSKLWIRYPALFLGSLAAMATSSDEDRSELPVSLVLGNPTKESLEINLSYLKEDVDINCEVVSFNPSLFLTRGLFERQISGISFESDSTIYLNNGRPDCNAVIVSGDNVEERIVFWNMSDFPETGYYPKLESMIDRLPDRVISLDNSGRWNHTHPTNNVIFDAPQRPLSRLNSECANPYVDAGLQWLDFSYGEQTISNIEPFGTGCYRINGQSQICLDGIAFPFEIGTQVTIAPLLQDDEVEGLRFVSAQTELIVSRGSQLPIGQIESYQVPVDCAGYHDACGQWVNPLSLTVRNGDSVFEASYASEIELDEQTTLHILRAQQNDIVNFSCDTQYNSSVDSLRIEAVLIHQLQ